MVLWRARVPAAVFFLAAVLWAAPCSAQTDRLEEAKAFKAAGRGMYVSLETSGPVKAHKWFAMDNPPRLVVDLPGKWANGAGQRLAVDQDGLKAVRVGLHPDKLRVVLDLDKGVFADPEFEPGENGLRIFLPFAASPAMIAPAPPSRAPEKTAAPVPEPEPEAKPVVKPEVKSEAEPATRPDARPEARAVPARPPKAGSPEPADLAKTPDKPAQPRRRASVEAEGKGCKVLDPDIQGFYSGGCRFGLAHGEGTAKGLDTYQGRFKEGAKEGHGVYEWANGLRYEGDFADDQRNGKGTLYFKDRAIYRGEFKNGLADGAGTFLFPDGGRYEGEFAKGLRQGYGIYLYPDGSIYEGAWVEDKRHGYGVFKWQDDANLYRYVGLFKDGSRHGRGRVLAKDKASGMVIVEQNGIWKDDAFSGQAPTDDSSALGYSLGTP